jgi:hypothetical protein
MIRQVKLPMVLIASLMPILAAAQPQPAVTKPLVTLAGANSRIESPTYLRITTAKDFQATFMQHLGKEAKDFNDHYNPDGFPTINFDRCMVIAVFAGKSWNSVGMYASQINDNENQITVRFDHRSYQTSGGADAVVPYGFFVVPRSDKAVILEENVQQYIGGEPVWKERARFQAISIP